MQLKSLEINSFKSFSKKTILEFLNPIVAIVGPNGSGKSNIVEAIRFVLGEQSMKSMRGKVGLDLIFKGSKSLPKSSRASVSICFNNTDKAFKLSNENGENINLNYDTISISREVYSDGLNKYILNGSEVRLKDINTLLALVNIGSSGYHIISQGEADRILNAIPKERREMIEDALGLKIYQYRIKEAERKLERTGNNMKEVSLLRRENAPHLNFLKKQVEKFEKIKEMKINLLSLYREYLKKESIYLEREKSNLYAEKDKISGELKSIAERISGAKEDNFAQENKKEKLGMLENKISEIYGIRNELGRKLGRIEGMIEMEEQRAQKDSKVVVIYQEDIKKIVNQVNSSINEALFKESLAEVKHILEHIKDILNKFNEKTDYLENSSVSGLEIQNLKKTQSEILVEMQKIENEEKRNVGLAEILKQGIASGIEAERDKEREKFTLKVRHQELSSSLELIDVKEKNLLKEMGAFENEIKEGSALIGSEILSYKNLEIKEIPERNVQEETKRKIERIKIKLEDAGISGGGEIIKEFNEVSDRDKFLAKEMEDLDKSITSLQKLVVDLKEKIDVEFKEGIKKINKEFQEFFSLMFDGGSAFLSVFAEQKKKKGEETKEIADIKNPDEINEEEEIIEQGIEINVSFPRKKVKELHALSGGERSLTSIALLFAMSQVNPPPFLVLDETDAALDEANSHKYGDMLEELSKHSQLIVVTHNRETMSRAGVLYGVTIGADGASKLLSVKFEEATAIAN